MSKKKMLEKPWLTPSGAWPHPHRHLNPLMAISFIKWQTNRHAPIVIILALLRNKRATTYKLLNSKLCNLGLSQWPRPLLTTPPPRHHCITQDDCVTMRMKGTLKEDCTQWPQINNVISYGGEMKGIKGDNIAHERETMHCAQKWVLVDGCAYVICLCKWCGSCSADSFFCQRNLKKIRTSFFYDRRSVFK